MEITFTCPHCNEVMLIGEEFVGQSGECRSCGIKIEVHPDVAPVSKEAPQSSSRRFSWMFFSLPFAAIFLLLLLCGSVTVFFHAPRVSPAFARMMAGSRNLKKIALAMQNYHDTYGQFPRAYWVAPSGERTLSWRVAILPFIEENALAEAYHADEPWNNAANLEVSKKAVRCYQNPWNNDENATEAYYMVITGPGTLFEEGKDITFDDCTDGTASTILAVEVKDSGVNWTQPIDLDIHTMIYQINSGSPHGIGGSSANGATVLLADGSVRFLPKDLLESTLRAMITRSGGESFEMP